MTDTPRPPVNPPEAEAIDLTPYVERLCRAREFVIEVFGNFPVNAYLSYLRNQPFPAEFVRKEALLALQTALDQLPGGTTRAAWLAACDAHCHLYEDQENKPL